MPFLGDFSQVGKCFLRKNNNYENFVVFKVLANFQEWKQCDIIVAFIDTRLDSSKALDKQILVASILFWVDIPTPFQNLVKIIKQCNI